MELAVFAVGGRRPYGAATVALFGGGHSAACHSFGTRAARPMVNGVDSKCIMAEQSCIGSQVRAQRWGAPTLSTEQINERRCLHRGGVVGMTVKDWIASRLFPFAHCAAPTGAVVGCFRVCLVLCTRVRLLSWLKDGFLCSLRKQQQQTRAFPGSLVHTRGDCMCARSSKRGGARPSRLRRAGSTPWVGLV